MCQGFTRTVNMVMERKDYVSNKYGNVEGDMIIYMPQVLGEIKRNSEKRIRVSKEERDCNIKNSLTSFD